MPDDVTQDITDEISKKDRTWLLPSHNKNQIKPGLYIVPTPIGNMGDITIRALDVLQDADLIMCEDTRVTGKLLNYFDIKHKDLIVYNDHSDGDIRDMAIKSIHEGACVALVSDAGAPMISDPGYKLLRACIDADVFITALPGANAPLPALQLSGLPTDCFIFAGYVPNKEKARADHIKRWAEADVPVICYETAPRLIKTLAAISELLGDRQIAVVREISKLYESARRGKAGKLIAHYQEFGPPKGEIVLIIGPSDDQLTDEEIEARLRAALKTRRTKEAAAEVAKNTGRSKSELYDLALVIAKDDKDDDNAEE
ncbi:MAG: 16S rRNA (cytidine(1402)-2'-O)-methyltransferase [Pseudomonadota bacterium]